MSAGSATAWTCGTRACKKCFLLAAPPRSCPMACKIYVFTESSLSSKLDAVIKDHGRPTFPAAEPAIVDGRLQHGIIDTCKIS